MHFNIINFPLFFKCIRNKDFMCKKCCSLYWVLRYIGSYCSYSKKLVNAIGRLLSKSTFSSCGDNQFTATLAPRIRFGMNWIIYLLYSYIFLLVCKYYVNYSFYNDPISFNLNCVIVISIIKEEWKFILFSR